MLRLHFAVGVQHRFGCRHGMKTRTKHYLSWPHAVGLHSLHCNRSWAPVLKKYVSTSWLAMRLCWNALELWQPKELWAVQGHGFSTAATSPGLNETHWLKRKFWEKSFFRGGSCLEYVQVKASHPSSNSTRYFRSLYIFHCIWVKPIPQVQRWTATAC